MGWGLHNPATYEAPMPHNGGQKKRWPRSGPRGYITPATRGLPNASEWGTKLEVAHKCGGWLHNPFRLGGAQRCRAGGGGVRAGPQVGRGAT